MKQTLSSTPALSSSYCCQGRWLPLESLNCSPRSLTHFLSGEAWHPICRPEAGPGACSPRVCFSLLSSGRPWGFSAPLAPHALSREPSPRVGGHLAPLPDLLMGWLPPLALASHHTPRAPIRKRKLSSPSACSFVDSSSPRLQMVWIHFSKWLCL